MQSVSPPSVVIVPQKYTEGRVDRFVLTTVKHSMLGSSKVNWIRSRRYYSDMPDMQEQNICKDPKTLSWGWDWPNDDKTMKYWRGADLQKKCRQPAAGFWQAGPQTAPQSIPRCSYLWKEDKRVKSHKADWVFITDTRAKMCMVVYNLVQKKSLYRGLIQVIKKL